MTKYSAIVALALCGACSPAATRWSSRAGAVTSVATLAYDWCQTMDAVPRFQSGELAEANWIQGRSPSGVTVTAYSAVAIVGVVALGQALPERWRPALYAGVTLLETAVIASNHAVGGRCSWR